MKIDELFLKPKTFVTIYHGTNNEYPVGFFLSVEDKKYFYGTTDKIMTHQFGAFTYKCQINTGKMADLTYESPIYLKILNSFTNRDSQRKKLAYLIDNGKVWRISKLAKKLYNYIWKSGFDSICLLDEKEDDYSRDKLYSVLSDTAFTYIVKNNGENIKILQRV